jgi:predicted nucleotidyltransferase
METRSIIAERLKRCDDISFAYLFGSRGEAQGARAESDWDVGVYMAEHLQDRERFALRLRLQADLVDLGTIDLVVLNNAPALLAHRALQGLRLFIRDKTAFVRFFTRTLAKAGDERYWHSLHMNARARRLREGNFGRP